VELLLNTFTTRSTTNMAEGPQLYKLMVLQKAIWC